MNILLNAFKNNIDFVWIKDVFPYYIDLDLQQICVINKISLLGNRDVKYCNYRMYGSSDGISFYRFLESSDCNRYRYIRLQILDCSYPIEEIIQEIRIYGEFTEDEGSKIEYMLQVEDFTETFYAVPITRQETEEYLYGIVERTVGKAYLSWFAFHLKEQKGIEQFTIYSGCGGETGKVCIEGNTGVALAAGLNYYYKNFCNVHISQQENQVKMPKNIILPTKAVKRKAIDSLRYAYNYCTLSYTMPFWGEKEWQKELDWLALNGVNLVLDFTGIEAVWYQFLKKYNYSDKEIRSWIVGPCYTAWQSMQNIEGFGGPLHPSFIHDRVELARKNQRKMRILGMHPVLQNYAGMVPTSHTLHDSEAVVYSQGKWNGINRPSMLDPTTPKFKKYARCFYEIQERIYGKESHFYAIDPFHEGGVRTKNLTDDKTALYIMENLLSYDPEAVWIVQAWRDNPTEGFLKGVNQYKQEHVLILDLSATDNPCFTKDEFQNTPWIYCMLDIYGGRVSTHGEPDVLAREIPKIRHRTKYMKGIGFTSEATLHNPIVYELLYEMAWEDAPIDLDSWIEDYAKRRYGFLTQEIVTGWMQLLKTAYCNPGYSHHGGYSQIFTYRPRLSMKKGFEFNELNSSVIKNPYYEPKEFYIAVKAFCDVYDVYKENTCYLYDLQDLLRQTLNLLATESAFDILDAYNLKDITKFKEASHQFFKLFDICNQLMQVHKDTLLGNWIGYAVDCGKQYDDFSEDLFLLNAKALITTWGYKETYLQLADYAYRQYGELLEEYYKKRWQIWIAHLQQALMEQKEAEEIPPDIWFQTDWMFVTNHKKNYRRVPMEQDSIFREAIKEINKFFN